MPPGKSDAYYEIRVHESGCVATRADNPHDLFNALAWLAFPRTKARINALHAAAIPGERGKRGRKRDLLTLFDEGGAMVQCSDPELVDMVRQFRWKELFWENRSRVLAHMRIVVIGHAVLDKARAPWPGVACKALPIRAGDADAQACAWLGSLAEDATPRALMPLPVFGYPGWLPGNDRPEFYEDTRYFRPFKREPRERYGKTG